MNDRQNKIRYERDVLVHGLRRKALAMHRKNPERSLDAMLVTMLEKPKIPIAFCTPGQGMAEACSTKLVVKRKREKTYAAGVYVTDQQHNSREALRNVESNHEIAGFPKVQL